MLESSKNSLNQIVITINPNTSLVHPCRCHVPSSSSPTNLSRDLRGMEWSETPLDQNPHTSNKPNFDVKTMKPLPTSAPPCAANRVLGQLLGAPMNNTVNLNATSELLTVNLNARFFQPRAIEQTGHVRWLGLSSNGESRSARERPGATSPTKTIIL